MTVFQHSLAWNHWICLTRHPDTVRSLLVVTRPKQAWSLWMFLRKPGDNFNFFRHETTGNFDETSERFILCSLPWPSVFCAWTKLDHEHRDTTENWAWSFITTTFNQLIRQTVTQFLSPQTLWQDQRELFSWHLVIFVVETLKLQLSIFHCFHCRAVWWSFQCTVTRTQWKNCPSSASTTTTRCTAVMETKTSTYQEGFSPPEEPKLEGRMDGKMCRHVRNRKTGYVLQSEQIHVSQSVFMNNQTEMCCRREVLTLQELMWRKEDGPNSEVLFWRRWTCPLFFTHVKTTTWHKFRQGGRARGFIMMWEREKVLCE